MDIVASVQPLAIPTHERFDRFILRKPERVRKPRGGCIALRLRATSSGASSTEMSVPSVCFLPQFRFPFRSSRYSRDTAFLDPCGVRFRIRRRLARIAPSDDNRSVRVDPSLRDGWTSASGWGGARAVGSAGNLPDRMIFYERRRKGVPKSSSPRTR